MNFDLIIKAVGAVVAAVVSLTRLSTHYFHGRARLKSDIEIMNMLDEDDPNYKLVAEHVNKSIHAIYSEEKDKEIPAVSNWRDLIFGIILLLFGMIWTLYVLRDGFSWWSIISILIVFASFGSILSGLHGESIFNESRSASRGKSQPTGT